MATITAWPPRMRRKRLSRPLLRDAAASGLAVARADQSLTWSAVAARAGFFDQAHLTREFKRFAGCTPSAYLGRDRSLTELFLTD